MATWSKNIISTDKSLVRTCATKLTELFISAGFDKAASIVAQLKDQSHAESYENKVISRIMTFKTLNGDGRDISLNDIYVPLSISNRIRGQEILITDGTTLKLDGCLSITGSAGQGKTTIMRKLFIEEMITADRFPFFITLRDCDYDKNFNCIDLVMEHLLSYGVCCEPSGVKELLASGRGVFYFDGFDEVDISRRLKVLKLITDSYYIYSCSSIITTRPDTELSKTSGIEDYYVDKLSLETVKSIVHKVVPEVSFANTIIDTIEKNAFLSETINTPILTSIFILTYLSFTDEPRSITDFYGVLFLSLMYKHDKNKNFTRSKLTNLSNNKLETCFSIFSYLSFIKGCNSFNEISLRDFFHQATSVITKEDISELIMDDVVNGTNIVVMDGYDRYVYIHRSIQEFFTAKAVVTFDEATKERFYNNILEDKAKARFFEQVLKMLSSIDDKNFARFYLLPKLTSLNLLGDDGYIKIFKGPDFRKIIGSTLIAIAIDNGVYSIGMMSNTDDNLPDYLLDLEDIHQAITYSTDDFQTSLLNLLSDDIQSLINGYMKNRQISLDEFNNHHVLNFSSDNPDAFNTQEGMDMMGQNDSTIASYFDGGIVTQEFEDEFARRVNGQLNAINIFLDDNVYKYNHGNLSMIHMLDPLGGDGY